MRQASRPNAQQSDSDLPQDSYGGTETVQTRQQARKAFSVLAVEYAHAVRNVFPGDELPVQAGHVQQFQQPDDVLENCHGQESDPGSQDTPGNRDASGNVRARDSSQGVQSSSSDSNAAVHAEAVKVKAKFASIDASNDVVLRFDFMNESDTRVKPATVCLGCICMPLLNM